MPFACWDGNGLSGGGGLAGCCCLSTARELTQLLVAAGSLAKAVVVLRVGSCSRIRSKHNKKTLVCYTRHFFQRTGRLVSNNDNDNDNSKDDISLPRTINDRNYCGRHIRRISDRVRRGPLHWQLLSSEEGAGEATSTTIGKGERGTSLLLS